MKQLRPYQIEAVQRIREHWSKNPRARVVLQLPTGAGKTVILSKIMGEDFAGKRILVVAHKIELVSQTVKHLMSEGIYPAVIGNKQQYERDLTNPVQVATVQSLTRIRGEWPKFDLIIVDECHHSGAETYLALFNHYRDVPFLGLSATPERPDGALAMYDELVTGVEVFDLIDKGFLVPFRLFAPPDEDLLAPERENIKTNAEGDYNEKALDQYMSKKISAKDIVVQWQKHIPDKLTVIYPHNVAFSREICQAFNDVGIPAGHIEASTPAGIREQTLHHFAQREILVLCQHSIVIEGVDIPNVEAIYFARPTKSKIIWFQAIGRALRPAPDKLEALILDHTSNHKNLPMPTVPQFWSLYPPLTLKTYDRYHSVKRCPECNFTFRLPNHLFSAKFFPRLVATSCPCPDCGHVLTWLPPAKQETVEVKDKKAPLPKPVEDETIEAIPISLVEYQSDVKLSKAMYTYIKEKVDKLLSGEFTDYQFRNACLAYPDMTYDGLLVVGNYLGYKKGWAYYKYQELSAQRQHRAFYQQERQRLRIG